MNEQHHSDLVAGIAEQFKSVLDGSTQAIYLYLDDDHKVCNKRFSALLGYASPSEWAASEAPLADVVESDQQAVIRAYRAAVNRYKASYMVVRFRNVLTHRTIKREMITLPVPFRGHMFTAQFIGKA